MNSIGPRLNGQEKWVAGTSYITIPYDADRDSFIHNCFLTGTVSILSEAGGIINNVPISKKDLQLIDFPDQSGRSGSQVFYVTDPVHNKQVIVATLLSEKEVSDNEEGEYVIKRIVGKSTCEIRINPKHETISLTATGDSPDITFSSVKGTYTVITTRLNLLSDTHSEKIETVKQVLVGNSDKYSRFIQNKDGFLFEGEKFIIQRSDESFMLGNLTKDFLDKFVDIVSKSTVMTSIGTQPLLNANQIAALKNETIDLLSKFCFLKNNK